MFLSDEEIRAIELSAREKRRLINRRALDNRLRGNPLALENLKRRTEAAYGETQNYVRQKRNYKNDYRNDDVGKTVVNR